MNASLTQTLHQLTGHTNINSVSVDELSALANEHPYFPLAQFLLARKLKENKSSEFLAQAQKSAVYFSNPLWLDYQLDEEFAVINVDDKIISEQTAVADKKLETPEVLNQETADENSSDEETLQTAQPVDEDLEIVIQPKQTLQPELENAYQANETQVVEVMEEMAGASHIIDEPTELFIEEATHKTATQPDPDDEHERMFKNIKAMLDATSEEAEADVNNTDIPLDPYYTIDYFASQGIKLDLDPNPQDKLGQNLKKFTHWLRHMKKLGPEDAKTEPLSSEAEADIQQIADSSIVAKEVVTEAMASVLEKQGKKDKAIELYNKLSFLNPHKSAYFAAKITNLKS